MLSFFFCPVTAEGESFPTASSTTSCSIAKPSKSQLLQTLAEETVDAGTRYDAIGLMGMEK